MKLDKLTRGYPISKMHGCGNDFAVLMDPSGEFDRGTTDVRNAVSLICNRHYGVGADGFIAIMASRTVDASYRMKFFNSDGSSAEMCGNGIRCLAKYLVDYVDGVSAPGQVTVDTDAGCLDIGILNDSGTEARVRVNMEVPILVNREQINADPGCDGVTRVTSNGIDNLIYVGMGNPHVVGFFDDPRQKALEYGSLIENDTDMFPEKTNVEFAQMISKDRIAMFVWERGVGETLACGTGACATFVAAAVDGRTESRATLQLLGGELVIEWKGIGNPVFLTGPARNVYEIVPETLARFLDS